MGSHFGVGAPIAVYFSEDWDVHWGYGNFDPWPCIEILFKLKQRNTQVVLGHFGMSEPLLTAGSEDHRHKRALDKAAQVNDAARGASFELCVEVKMGRNVHWLKSMCYFPLLVLKGIYHYWIFLFMFVQGLNQIEGHV